MGPSPASARPSSLSASPPKPLSAADEWFLASSDRDTFLFTQAITRELSSPGAPCPSSSSLSQTLGERLDLPDWSDSLSFMRALQQQKQNQKQQHQQQRQAEMAFAMQAATMSCALPRQDGFHYVDHSSLQRGSPPSRNSHSPLPVSNPGSPHSNSTTNSAISIPTDGLLPHIKHSTPLHQDVMGSTNLVTPKSLHSSRAALSSQASLGAGENKVSKRRSRASNRAPIAVLSADVSNFRAMVQQLTGIPSTPSMLSYGTSSLLKPHPIKHPYTNTTSLPTLDTSACYLGPKPTMNEGFSFAQRNYQPSSGHLLGINEAGRQQRNARSMLRSDIPFYANKQCVYGYEPNVSSSSSTLSSIWSDASAGKPRESFPPVIESQQSSTKQAPNAVIEEYPPTKSQYNAVDSWLSFDGVLANHASNMEIARMA